jgi:Ca2+-binding RTX toxin-like protein
MTTSATLAAGVGGGTTVAAYNPATDIPAGALDAKDFPSINAWLDACIEQDKPGKIGSGTYSVDGLPRYAPKGIYGYGDTQPKLVAQNTDAWLYLSNHDVTIKGVEFDNFGEVVAGAQKLQAGHPYHSTTEANFGRFLVGNGHALGLTEAASSSVVGPAVTISDSTFVNDQHVYTFVSDTTQAGAVEFNNNKLVGTWGGIDVNSLYWTQVNASGNEMSGNVGDRVEPTLKNNGYQTEFKIGTDYYVPLAGHTTKLNISNNYEHDVQSISKADNTNAAVFADVRGAESKNPGDNVISYNTIEHVKGILGQEDSNAIYAKAWGLTIQGNHIVDTGADYVDAKKNGSETTGILVKPMTQGIAKDINIVGNLLENMPSSKSGIDLSEIKLSEAVGNSSISFNTIIGGGNTSTDSASGIIRYYSTAQNLSIVGNSFVDTTLAPGSAAINIHSLVRSGAAQLEISNNHATLSNGSYASDQAWIHLDGDNTSTANLVTGHNDLEGGHIMTLNRPSNGSAPVRTYTGLPAGAVLDGPTTGPGTGGGSSGGGTSAGTGAITLSNVVSTIAENSTVAGGVKLADLTLTGITSSSASLVLSGADAASFAIATTTAGGHTLNYIGSAPNFEAKAAYAVTVSAADASAKTSSDVHQDFTLHIADVNEAPTALTFANALSALPDHGAVNGGVKVADINVTDDALGTNTLSLGGIDAAAFAIRDTATGGHALYYIGASPDLATKSAYGVTVTSHDASLPISADLHQSFTLGVTSGPSAPSGPISGDDIIHGTSGPDTLLGTVGDDVFDGGAGADRFLGNGGNDTVSYDSAAAGVKASLMPNPKNVGDALGDTYVSIESLLGSSHNDTLSGDNRANTLVGGDGDDIISGQGGADTILGGAGNDKLNGNGGNDRLEGGAGDDTLSGGSGGRDWFAYTQHSWGNDTISDFENNRDVIDFRGSGVTLNDLQITQHGSDVLVQTADHVSSILIQHMQLPQINAADFIFA